MVKDFLAFSFTALHVHNAQASCSCSERTRSKPAPFWQSFDKSPIAGVIEDRLTNEILVGLILSICFFFSYDTLEALEYIFVMKERRCDEDL